MVASMPVGSRKAELQLNCGESRHALARAGSETRQNCEELPRIGSAPAWCGSMRRRNSCGKRFPLEASMPGPPVFRFVGPLSGRR